MGSFRAQAKQELLCGLRIGCNAMPTGLSWKKDERRQHRAVLKYKKVEGDKWSIDTSKLRGAVRPIDLVSRDPDRLREHVTIEAAVAFEEECTECSSQVLSVCYSVFSTLTICVTLAKKSRIFLIQFALESN